MSDGQPTPPEGQPEGDGRPWRPWVLIALLLVVPGALYAAVLAVPFLPLTTAQKVGLAAGLVFAAEAVFWIAALWLGKGVISRYRRYFDPRTWRRER